MEYYTAFLKINCQAARATKVKAKELLSYLVLVNFSNVKMAMLVRVKNAFPVCKLAVYILETKYVT